MTQQPEASLEEECAHDYDRATRKGRASYECPRCHNDISLSWFLWMECVGRLKPIKANPQE